MDQRGRGGGKFKVPGRLATASALLAASLWFVPSVAMANPAIALSPDKGPVGTSVTVSGSGFEAHSLATVHWADLTLTDFTTNALGEFSVGIVVPQVKDGAQDVVVRSTAGAASARFVVQAPEPPTTTTTPTTTSSTTTSTSTTTTVPTTTTTTAPTTTAPTTTTTTPTTTTTTPTTTTTTAPTTTTPSPTTTTPYPTTTTPSPTTTTPDSTTTSPTQTTWEQTGPTPTDPDPRDPTTSTTRSATDDGDPPPSTADPSADTTGEDPGRAAESSEESTTSTTVTRVTSQMTIPFPTRRASGGDDGPPDLTGGRMAVGEFSLAPAEGFPGATLELSFRFNRAIPGLTSVQVMMDDTALGDEIPVEESSFSVRRTVPDLPPDTYEVTVHSDDLLLATAEFTVLEPGESATGSTPVVVLGVLAMVAGLGWRATRNFQGDRSSSGALGPVDRWYAWRERRRR